LLVTKKRREADLIQIAVQFTAMYKAVKGIYTVQVTSAIPLDATLRNEVIAVAKKSVQGEVELIEKVDAKIIGGFIIKIGDRQFDASVSKRLKDLTKEFSGNQYVPQLN